MVILLHLSRVRLKACLVGNQKGGEHEKELRKESSWRGGGRGSVELSNISCKVGLGSEAWRIGLHKRRWFLFPWSFSLSLCSRPSPFFFSLLLHPSILPSPRGWSKRMTVRQCPASPSGRVIILSGAKSLPPLARQTCHTQREKEAEREERRIKWYKEGDSEWRRQGPNKGLRWCTQISESRGCL